MRAGIEKVWSKGGGPGGRRGQHLAVQVELEADGGDFGKVERLVAADREVPDAVGPEADVDVREVAAGEQFLYVTGSHGHGIASFTHDGTEVTDYVELGKTISCPTLAPGGLLFCVLANNDDHLGDNDEIIALDAQTLQPRYRFGLSLLNCPCGMAAVGEELFVCDPNNDRIQVFSLAGEHRRSITGAWKKPDALCLVEDRLYLVEQDDEDYDEEDEDEEVAFYNLHAGRRIFVLSLLGETLQVYTHPFEGQHDGQFSDALCYFDGRLLAPMASFEGRSAVTASVAAFRDA